MKLRTHEKTNIQTMNIYDFSDKLNSDRATRENFVSEYVNHLKKYMDVDDIISEWAEMVYEKYMREIKDSGADNLVEDVAHHSPDWLKSRFKVDPSLAQV